MGNKFIMKVSTAELSNAINSIDLYDGKTRLKVEDVLNQGAKWVANGARQRVAVRSGKTKNSIKSSLSRPKLESYVKATTPQAHLVEFGVKPHSLDKGAKRKVMVINGHPVSGKIMHPGTKARPFMKPAFEAEVGAITRAIVKAVGKV